MAHALGISRSDMLLYRMQDDEPAAFTQLISAREKSQPVAQIIGEQEFFGLTLAITPDVLIPRSDSESVVEASLRAKPDARRVLDCGTGSGALLLALLANFPQAEGVGIERSAAAVEVARANAASLDLANRARVILADWHQPGWADDLGRFDLIIANPPYVEDDADLAPDVRLYEPAAALFAGAQGLDDYRVLIPQLPRLLTQTGVAMLEIGATQAAQVSEIAREHGFTAHAHPDLAGRDRALELRLTLGKAESVS